MFGSSAEAAVEQIDWLLIDVICVPEQLASMLYKWLANRRCRKFVATIKVRFVRPFCCSKMTIDRSYHRSQFLGETQCEQMNVVKRALNEHASHYDFAIRHTAANKNEATAMGELIG